MEVETEKISEQKSLDDLKPIEQEGVNLESWDKKEVEIEKAEIMQVPSKYVDEEAGGMQWVLKVSSKVLETLGEGDDKIEFRASELFNLVQDKKGKLKGYPSAEASNLGKFMKDVKAKDPKDLEGKKAMVKSYQKEYDGNSRTYLKFRY